MAHFSLGIEKLRVLVGATERLAVGTCEPVLGRPRSGLFFGLSSRLWFEIRAVRLSSTQ